MTEAPVDIGDGKTVPDQMSLPEALLFGTRLHRLGRRDEAEAVYRAVLALAPEHPDALQFLGIVCFERGARDDALALVRRSAALAPQAAGPQLNLGNLLLEAGDVEAAAAAYKRAAALGAPNAELCNNLGVLHRHGGRLAEAEAAYRRALTIDDRFIDAYNNLGHLLASQGRHEEALQEYCKALALKPADAQSRRVAALALCTLGRMEAAARLYRECLADEPDHPLPRHYLAACTGEAVPERASDAYVVATFDAFAGSFDARLEQLTYRAPGLVAETVAALCGPPRAALDVLDAGCGTGLCGPLLAPFARRLEGVDLSGGMLAQARARGCYHALHQAELCAWLAERPRAYNLIACADTLCYFGPLEGVARAACAALRAGARFVFTVEAHAGEAAGPYQLHPHGRYSHRADYLRHVLTAAGFAPPQLAEAVLRREAGRPVQGYVVAARRPPIIDAEGPAPCP
jgi:predicted TPR repeat methyltransferase